MKFFLDTANLSEIEEAASWGVLAGVTTNPSLYAREGGRSPASTRISSGSVRSATARCRPRR